MLENNIYNKGKRQKEYKNLKDMTTIPSIWVTINCKKKIINFIEMIDDCKRQVRLITIIGFGQNLTSSLHHIITIMIRRSSN